MIPQVVMRCGVCQNRAAPFLKSYSNSPAVNTGPMMPFEDYRKLKKTMKFRARIWGVPFAFAGMSISSTVNVMLFPNILEMAADDIQPILGMDPLMFAALTGMAAAGVGFFVGGILHNEFWKLFNKEQHRQLTQYIDLFNDMQQWNMEGFLAILLTHNREEDFLRRIQKYRFAEFGSFYDDYYGDKVQTLSDYRQWVREQQKKKELHKDYVPKEETET